MKRWLKLSLILLVWWAVPYTPDEVPAQAAINRSFTVLASAAQTGNGANTVTGGAVDVTACLLPGTTSGYVLITVPITAGSGTVTTFKVWLQGSADGTNWAAIPCWGAMSATATAFTATSHLAMNETALQTSGTGQAYCSLPVGTVRAAWIVNGTTPSETFSVLLGCYS